MKREVKRFARFIRSLDWFEWFYLSFIVFASTLFFAVVSELQKEIRG